MMRAEPDADLRHKLRKLLQELLTEAADKAKGVTATDSIVEEAANDEDHR